MDKALLKTIFILNNLVLVLFGCADAEGSAGGCAPEVRVRKNTVLIVSSKMSLTISCPVRYCQEIPAVKWTKLTRTTNLSYDVSASETDQITVTQEPSTAHPKVIISHLSFKSISTSDGGIYRCIALGSGFVSESHNIVVSVSDTDQQSDNGTVSSTDASTEASNGGSHEWMAYIIICSGIIGLVTVVMSVFFLSVFGCKCSREKGKKLKTQVPPSPNVSKFNGHHGDRETSEQKRIVSKLSAETLQLDMPSNSSSRDQENTPQQQIVYATLEHLAPRDPPAVHHPSNDQHSEYAAIRIS